MPFTLLHEHLVSELTVQISIHDDLATVSCALSGKFGDTERFPGSTPIRFPGKLIKSHYADYTRYVYNEEHPGRQDKQVDRLSLTFEIRTPDGQPFTADHVTLDDLRRFRDLRGTSHGDWTFHLHGQSDPIPVYNPEAGEDPQTGDNMRVVAGKGSVRIAVEETVASKSAPPLIADTLSAAASRRYNFDLFRVGTLVARAVSARTHKQLTLYDPDGHVVARGAGALRYPVTLQTLDKSRDEDGKPRLWSLEARADGGFPPVREDVDVLATVVAATGISTPVLQDRINLLIGERGEKISIYGEMEGTDLLARLVIFDEVSAETIDMWGLLDSVIENPFEHRTGPPDIAANVPYILLRRDRVIWKSEHKSVELRVSLHNMKISDINISIGASVEIQPSIPALKVDVGVEGYLSVDCISYGVGIPLGTARVRDNRLRLEAGLRVLGNGSLTAETWIKDDILKLGVTWSTDLALALAGTGLVGAVTVETVTPAVESILNSTIIPNGFHHVVNRAMNRAPQVLAVMMGDDLTYRDIRMDGENIEFDYGAPLEPDPKPAEGYVGIIGRSAVQIGPTTWDIEPPTLGDHWSAQNLAKIDHIVMVMMENRSFDHVLGYRAQLPGLETSDGLTTELIGFLNSLEFEIPDSDQKKFPINKLNAPDSDIPPNSIGKRTALPRHVGHSLADVADQLMLSDEPPRYIKTPSGRWINSPKGFIRNWNEKRADGLKREDVLGYYDSDDLPFFRFLAENYAYCEKYFCSHPGPTIPNRMFSLAGDVQYDRTGEAILNNNYGDNFYLSRAPTVFELLTRKGIGWRVYESFPSITMLRMFARYAGDNTNIVPLGDNTDTVSRLRADVAAGNLPAVTFVDPAFHHHPQSDDHPEDARERPAVDIWRGQKFLKDVYDALVSNKDLWRKTLLIITYDEHGGFYDHVIPPLAEGLYQPPVVSLSGMGTAVSSMEIRYGVRVPTFVVSPWTPAGKRLDIVLDHCSILKTIIARFLAKRRHREPHGTVYYTAPFLSDRVDTSHSFDAYLSAAEPRLDVPASPPMADLASDAPPHPRAIITEVLSRAQMRRGNVHFHDLTGRLARQLGR